MATTTPKPIPDSYRRVTPALVVEPDELMRRMAELQQGA
jgi:hypothetical protein